MITWTTTTGLRKLLCALLRRAHLRLRLLEPHGIAGLAAAAWRSERTSRRYRTNTTKATARRKDAVLSTRRGKQRGSSHCSALLLVEQKMMRRGRRGERTDWMLLSPTPTRQLLLASLGMLC